MSISNRPLALVFVTAPLLLQSALACDPLALTSDPYKVERGSQAFGTGEISLRQAAAESCFVLEQTATPAFLLRWISGPATQSSEFCLLPDGSLRNYSYSQFRTGVGAKKENYELVFDWQKMEVRGGRFESAPLSPDQSDQLLLQLKVRRWLCDLDWSGTELPTDQLKLELFTHRGPDTYTFAISRSETIEVDAGRFDTVVVSRIDSPDRRSEFWLERGQNYRLIRAEQQKRDDPPVRLSLIRDN